MHRIIACGTFIATLILSSCTNTPREAIRIFYGVNNTPEAIEIHSSALDALHPDSVAHHLRVQLKGGTEGLSILGHISNEGGYYRFTPIVPFTRGQAYVIKWRLTSLGEITVPADETVPQPQVIAIYPSADTIPENTLKIYVHFSTPMSEGKALKHIVVTESSGDTLSGTFLDLQPELWNDDRTVLTLWIDPGRVKRDLIPNQEMGIPLPKGELYTVSVIDAFKSARGAKLEQPFRKSYYVGDRDVTRPSVGRWKLEVPQPGTTASLRVMLDEPLDKWQLEQDISIRDFDNTLLQGRTEAVDGERAVSFEAATPWRPGEYVIEVRGTLEDHAGNNLNRLFDTDLNEKTPSSYQEMHTLHFVVR